MFTQYSTLHILEVMSDFLHPIAYMVGTIQAICLCMQMILLSDCIADFRFRLDARFTPLFLGLKLKAFTSSCVFTTNDEGLIIDQQVGTAQSEWQSAFSVVGREPAEHAPDHH